MFTIASLIFIVFTVGYALAAGAVIYHLRQYTLPHDPKPKAIMGLFLFLSCFLWLLALYFLLVLA